MKYARMLLLRLLIVCSVLVFSSPAQATNYITAVGVQQFSITIASGSTTGTATITAVGSGAFIIYGGINTPSGNGVGSNEAYLTKTNSTTITATMAATALGSVVVTGCIIDADTTNLIKSVQYGTVTIAGGAASGTATISAVTNNNTAIHYLGTSVNLSFGAAADFPRLSLSGTTVTSTITTANATGQVDGFVAIEFQGSALNQAVQNVSAASSGTVASWTATITSVSTANSIIINGGFTSGNGTFTNVMVDGTLTNGTTVTAQTTGSNSLARIYNGTVVEFVAGLLNSSVQRGTTTLTGVTSNTSTITGVTVATSGITYLGNVTNVATSNFNESEGQVALTSSTAVTTTKNNATGNITSSWEVFELPAFSGGGATGNSLNAIWFGSEF